MTSFLGRLRWFLISQLGLDLRKLRLALFRLPRYIRDWRQFSRLYSGPIKLMPCIHDRYESAGSASDEYFWQDLYVARKIFAAAPHRHVDVGSRVDGFVAHVASFREIEILDIRPMPVSIPGVQFRQADLMASGNGYTEYCDSLSCLHALEHFGLGRYGDPIDVDGYKKGLTAFSEMLIPNGVLYLAAPTGRECVMYNAHRIFSLQQLVQACSARGLLLESLAWFIPGQVLMQSDNVTRDIAMIEQQDYALSIMILRKAMQPGSTT